MGLADTIIPVQGKIRILHVDDEPDQLLFTRTLLEDADPRLEIVSVSSPFEALDRVASFDCILTDYQMPGMDGVEFARKAKKITIAPVILYTGRGSEEVASAAFAAGANDYLRKEMDPGHYQVLARRILHAVEAQRVERILRESDEKYRMLLDANMDAVYVITGGRFVYMNRIGAEIVGYTVDELIGRPTADIVVPEQRDVVMRYAAERVSGGHPPTRYEIRLLRKDGSTVEIETNATVITYEGKPSILSVSRDVTESKRMSTELKTSEERYRTVLDASMDAICVVQDGKYAYINRKAVDIMGYEDPAELLGRDVFEFFHPEEKERIAGYIKARQSGTPAPTEYVARIVRRDGAVLTIETKIATLNFNGRPASLAISRDITEREKAAEALRHSESEKTTLLSTIPDALCLIDRGYRYLWVNDVEAVHVGATPDELIGRLCFNAYIDRATPCDSCRVSKVFETGKPETWRTEDARGRSWQTLANPVIEGGKVTSVIVLSRDITEGLRSQNRTNALHSSTLKLDGARTEDEVWAIVFSALTDVLGYKQTGIGIVEGGFLKFKAAYRVTKLDNFLPLDGRSVTLRALRTGETQIVADALEDPDYVSATPSDPSRVWRSELAVPIFVDGRCVAVLNAESQDPGAFKEDDRMLIELLSNYSSQALTRIHRIDDLRESEKRYRSFLDSQLDAIFVLDAETYLYANPAAAALLGYDSPADFVGKPVFFFVAPEDVELVRKRTNLRLSGEDAPNKYEIRLLNRYGCLVYTEVSVSRITYEGKSASLGVHRDITERKRMEEALRRNEAEKSALLETIPDGLSVVDRDFVFQWINEFEAARVGKLPADMLGKPCYKFFGDGNSICEKCQLKKVFRDGTSERWTSTLPDGKIWDFVANPIIGPDGAITSAIVLSKDVTDLLRSQKQGNALHTSALKIESMTTEDGVWRVVHDTLINVLGYKLAGIGLVEGDKLVSKPDYSVIKTETIFPLTGGGVIIRAIRSLKPQLVRDTRLDADYITTVKQLPLDAFRSELAVPVVVDGVAIAVINTESNPPNVYTADDQRLIETLALYAAQAIKRIRQMRLLTESEVKYRQLAENAADVLFIVAVDGTITYTSKAVNPQVGYTREELVGRRVSDFLTPEEAEKLAKMFTDTLSAAKKPGSWTSMVLDIQKKGGGFVSLEFNPSPIINEGQLTAIQVVVRDVSERIALQRKLNALHLSAHKLGEAENLAQVWKIGVDTLRSVLGFRRADIGVIVGDAVKFSHGLNKDHPELVLPLNGRGITVRAIKMMHTQLVQDVSKDESYVSGVGVPMKYASELVVPIISDERVVAVINLEDDKINAFTEEDINLAETLALHVASAVGRLWRADKSQIERARLTALHKSSIRLSTASSIDEVWRLVFEDLRDVMGFDMTGVGLVIDGAVRFTRGTSHIPADTFEIPLSKPSVSGRAVKTKETQYVRNIRNDPDYVEGPRREGVKPYNAEIAVPVIVDGEVVAVLNVEVAQPKMLGDSDVRLMETLALHAATAVSRLRQREDERRYRQRLEILNRHASDLEGVETLKDALRFTYDSLVALGLMSPSISLLQGDVLSVPAIEGRPSVSPMFLPMSGPGITVRAVKTKKTQLCNDASSDPDLVPSPDGMHIGSELVVPMKISDEVIGVLNLESVEPNAYTEEDARIVEMLASHVSSTLARLRLLEGLHRQVEERTGALLVAEHMVAAGKVSAMVAHDLRGPLQTISNASRVVRKKPEKTVEMLGYIDSAVERSIRMLEDLRLNTREEPLRLADTDLHELVSQAIKELPNAEGIELEAKVGDGLKAVSIDPLKIRRVLDNLLRNAVEAMPGGGKITVNAKTVDGEVVIDISDTGKGIPPGMVDLLFRPFATTKASGLGLGLTYCKKAVEDHGGTITGRNAQGGGAVFSIRLPLKRVE